MPPIPLPKKFTPVYLTNKDKIKTIEAVNNEGI